jgi:hypothetical protein
MTSMMITAAITVESVTEIRGMMTDTRLREGKARRRLLKASFTKLFDISEIEREGAQDRDLATATMI